MIRNFASKTAQDIYDDVNSRYARKLPRELHPKARRLLDQINAAPSLEFLHTPPSNRLEKLSGKLRGFWSLRINDQWRIIFRWINNDALDVENYQLPLGEYPCYQSIAHPLILEKCSSKSFSNP
jgi:proteic killer suppression protein